MKREELIKGRKYTYGSRGRVYVIDDITEKHIAFTDKHSNTVNVSLDFALSFFTPVETDEVEFSVESEIHWNDEWFSTTIRTTEHIDDTYKLIRPKTPQSLSEWLEANGMSEQEAIDKLKTK